MREGREKRSQGVGGPLQKKLVSMTGNVSTYLVMAPKRELSFTAPPGGTSKATDQQERPPAEQARV